MTRAVTFDSAVDMETLLSKMVGSGQSGASPLRLGRHYTQESADGQPRSPPWRADTNEHQAPGSTRSAGPLVVFESRMPTRWTRWTD